MTSRLIRVLAATGMAAAVVFGLSACGVSVPKADLAQSVTTKLAEQNVTADGMNCPEDLKGETGASVECAFTTGGQPVGAKVTVTGVESSNVAYEVTLVAKPVDKALLEKTMSEQIGKQAGVTVSSTTCDGDLPPQVGANTSCTVTAPGEQVDFDVAVTEVTSGLVKFAWQPKA